MDIIASILFFLTIGTSMLIIVYAIVFTIVALVKKLVSNYTDKQVYTFTSAYEHMKAFKCLKEEHPGLYHSEWQYHYASLAQHIHKIRMLGEGAVADSLQSELDTLIEEQRHWCSTIDPEERERLKRLVYIAQ